MKKSPMITLGLALALGAVSAACSSIQTAHAPGGSDTSHPAQDLAKAGDHVASVASPGALGHVDDVKNPEDLVAIPGTRWIIASGMAPNSGLHLIDRVTKKAQRWFAPKASGPSAQYPDSDPQPDPDEMQVHGISLREIGEGKYLLLAVNHNGKDAARPDRETIEILEVDAAPGKPVISWLGNVRLPKGLAGNAVVSAPDGSIYTTVMLMPGYDLKDMFGGKPTGAVYRWTPKKREFEKLLGTELNGNNGIELSRDGRYMFVAHMQGMSKFSIGNPARKIASSWLDYGLADNLHWDGDRLVTAGSMLKDCHQGVAPDCLDGFHITYIDPEDMKTSLVIRGDYTDRFSGVSTVLPVEGTFWLGSFYRDTVAYFKQDRLKQDRRSTLGSSNSKDDK